MPGIFITIMDEINIGQWSSGQVGEGKKYVSTLIQCFVSDRWKIFPDRMQTTDGDQLLLCVENVFEFSILSENPSIVSYSRRHHHWTSFGSSRCKNSWRIRHRSCNSVNCKPRVHNLRCYIQRKGAFCEWNSWSQTRTQVQQWIARKPSPIRKKWRKRSNQKPRGNLGSSEHEVN